MHIYKYNNKYTFVVCVCAMPPLRHCSPSTFHPFKTKDKPRKAICRWKGQDDLEVRGKTVFTLQLRKNTLGLQYDYVDMTKQKSIEKHPAGWLWKVLIWRLLLLCLKAGRRRHGTYGIKSKIHWSVVCFVWKSWRVSRSTVQNLRFTVFFVKLLVWARCAQAQSFAELRMTSGAWILRTVDL